MVKRFVNIGNSEFVDIWIKGSNSDLVNQIVGALGVKGNSQQVKIDNFINNLRIRIDSDIINELKKTSAPILDVYDTKNKKIILRVIFR